MWLLRRVLVLLLIIGTSAAKKIPRWNIKVGQEQGPNACIVEEIPGTNFKHWTECRYQMNREICGQKTVIRYDCCGGYHRIQGTSGCTGVNSLSNILQTAKDFGAGKFVEFIEQAGLKDKLSEEGAFTLFAPIDHAFERLSNDQRLRLVPTNNRGPSTVLLHVVDRKVTSDEFMSDSTVPSLYRSQQLRLNKYNNGMKTVNCNLIVRKDLQATNGIVHLIDKILEPYVFLDLNLADAVVQDGRFTELAKAMENSKCKRKLQNSQQSYTILAPSDEAFQKLAHGKMERILNDPETKEALLDSHVIPHPTCLSAITGKSKLRTLGSEKLQFDCDSKGISVNGRRIRNQFQIGHNGILYMVDDIILPDKAKGVMQLAEQEKLFTFSQLIKNAKLVDTLENMPNLTIFAPSEAAMYSIPKEELQALKDDSQKARDFVLYHAMEGQLKSNKMSADKQVRSLDRRNTLRLQVQHNALGVENAMLEKRDISGMNTCIHVLSKPLSPPTLSTEVLLRRMGNFSYFIRGLSHVLRDSAHNSSLTMLAPTDDAFRQLGSAKLKRFTNDRKYTNKIMKNHVIENLLSTNMLKQGLSYQMQTRYKPVYFTFNNGKLKVDDAIVTSPDLMTTNGVVHVINKVLLPEHNRLH